MIMLIESLGIVLDVADIRNEAGEFIDIDFVDVVSAH